MAPLNHGAHVVGKEDSREPIRRTEEVDNFKEALLEKKVFVDIEVNEELVEQYSKALDIAYDKEPDDDLSEAMKKLQRRLYVVDAITSVQEELYSSSEDRGLLNALNTNVLGVFQQQWLDELDELNAESKEDPEVLESMSTLVIDTWLGGLKEETGVSFSNGASFEVGSKIEELLKVGLTSDSLYNRYQARASVIGTLKNRCFSEGKVMDKVYLESLNLVGDQKIALYYNQNDYAKARDFSGIELPEERVLLAQEMLTELFVNEERNSSLKFSIYSALVSGLIREYTPAQNLNKEVYNNTALFGRNYRDHIKADIFITCLIGAVLSNDGRALYTDIQRIERESQVFFAKASDDVKEAYEKVKGVVWKV